MKSYLFLVTILAFVFGGCSSEPVSPLLTQWSAAGYDAAWAEFSVGDGTVSAEQSENIGGLVLAADADRGLDACISVNFDSPIDSPYEIVFGAADSMDRPLAALVAPAGFKVYIADVSTIEANGLVLYRLGPGTPVHRIAFAVRQDAMAPAHR